MGKLKSVVAFDEPKNCAEDKSEDSPPCCEDVHTLLKVEEISQSNFEFDSCPQLYEVALIVWSSYSCQLELNNEKEYFSYYPQPPPDRDILSHYQVYLI